jgi:hypothetical protein
MQTVTKADLKEAVAALEIAIQKQATTMIVWMTGALLAQSVTGFGLGGV